MPTSVARSSSTSDAGYESDEWKTCNRRTGQSEPLRADRWYRDELEEEASPDCSGILCNIWERAKKRSLLTHRLASGGQHNVGYVAVPWESILHGKCGEYGAYKILSVLPDKLGRYFFEYHAESYASLGIPALPEHRSQINVHGMLKPFQVSLFLLVLIYTCIIAIKCIIDIKCVICIISDQKSPGHT